MSSTSAFSASRRASAQRRWGLFLEEHPELTEQARLEVTDELVFDASPCGLLGTQAKWQSKRRFGTSTSALGPRAHPPGDSATGTPTVGGKGASPPGSRLILHARDREGRKSTGPRADPVLAEATELARVLAWAHQGSATQLVGDGWDHARKYFSLSEKYAKWADYRAPAKGFGIHAHAHEVSEPIRLTDEELRAHGEWRNFGPELEHHPPMRGWLAVPIIGSDGVNYGFIQVSDRLEDDFTEQDEANLVRLAALTSTALDALAQVHLPDYRQEVAERSSG